MNTTSDHTVRNCTTCVHYLRWTCAMNASAADEYARCVKFRKYSDNAIIECKLEHWQAAPPKPPKRSLRQWLYDIFWKK